MSNGIDSPMQTSRVSVGLGQPCSTKLDRNGDPESRIHSTLQCAWSWSKGRNLIQIDEFEASDQVSARDRAMP